VFKNTAKVDDLDIEEPDDPPIPPVVRRSVPPLVDEINEGDRVISGTGVPGASVTVSFPNSTRTETAIVDADGTWSVNVPGNVNLLEGDIVKAAQTEPGYDPSVTVEVEVQAKRSVIPYMTKTSENLTSTDDKTRVGDRLLYTVTIGNSGAKSIWTGTVLTDELPLGVSLTGNVYDVVLLDGIRPTFCSYNPTTRVLQVNVGDVRAGSERVVTFEVTVDANAYGMNIKNGASVIGKENGGSKDVEDDCEEDGDGRDVIAKSDKPTIDPVTRGDEKIHGTGEPGAKIEVELQDGTKLDTVVDNDGNWVVDVPPGKEPNTGDEIKAIQTETGKDPSDPEKVTVVDKNYRAVHGFVWPMLDKAPGALPANLVDDFMKKHDIVVELRPTFRTPADAALSTTAKLVANASLAGLGEFTIENVPFGTYILYIHRPGYLARAMEITVSGSSLDIIELAPPTISPPTNPSDDGIFKLWWGDCNGSLRIDNEDILMIMEDMDLKINAQDPRYNPACDMNGDGLVDNEDILMVLDNWNKFARQYAGGENINYFD